MLDKDFDSVAIDFVGPLPIDDGFHCIVTMTDRLGTDIQLATCNTNMTAEEFAAIFFDQWFCENGCPSGLITDRDKLFVSCFWKALMKLSGIKHKMSTAFHPQTDGSSERSNKTVIQALRFHVEHNQAGWAKALPKVRFDMMNTINASTGFTPFMLKLAHASRLISPLLDIEDPPCKRTVAPTSEIAVSKDTQHNTDTRGTQTLPKPTPAEQRNVVDTPPKPSLPNKNTMAMRGHTGCSGLTDSSQDQSSLSSQQKSVTRPGIQCRGLRSVGNGPQTSGVYAG
jgi:hypothetical protein